MEKTENYDETLARLNEQLNSIDVPKSPGEGALPSLAETSSSPAPAAGSKWSFTLNPIYIYGGIPITVLILFLIIQPAFLREEIKDEKGEKKTALNFKKVVIWTAVISTVIDVGIFAYFYQQKKAAATKAV